MSLPGPLPTPTLIDSVRLTEEGVEILDRRVYPFECSWVQCATVEHVAIAIKEMVTQSSGSRFAATAGMILAARAVCGRPPDQATASLRLAGALLVATRPTNNHIRDAVDAVLHAIEASPRATAGADLLDVVVAAALAHDQRYRAESAALGRHTAALIPDGARILTHCWADHFLVATVQAAAADGKRLEFVCTETRPYLQGARLTAAALVEMGFEPIIVTDGMVAAAMAARRVDVLVTAADRVTLDGHVVNKVGTLQAALAANHARVPFYAMIDAPDPQAVTIADVAMEERNGDEVLSLGGTRTAAPQTRGWYPAFDATPPSLVTRIVTSRGAYPAPNVARHFDDPAS